MVNLGIVALKSGDKAIKGKAKRTTQSQVLRWKIEEYYDRVKQDDAMPKESFYRLEMSRIINKYIEDKLI